MSGQRHSLNAMTPEPTVRRAKAVGCATPPGLAEGKPGAGRVASDTARVLCVDDHAAIVDGLRAAFAIDGDITVVGRLATAARLTEAAERLCPDAVVLDIEMPGPDAFEMADRLKRARPEIRIVVLSAYIKDAYITAAFRTGASAYFSKSDEPKDIIAGIREVIRSRAGGFVLGPVVAARCRPEPGRGAATDRKMEPEEAPDGLRNPWAGTPTTMVASLTEREAEILRLVGKGLPRTQIAEQLCRSVKTIDGHQDRMMRKLGIASRADLMRFAIREGLAEA
jgi:two-component system, NarL family, response regulator LiaR